MPHDLYAPHSHNFDEPGPPSLERLSEIQVPALIIVGEDDVPDNHAVSGVLQVGIENAKRVVVAGSGHLVNLEQPERFNEMALDFLAK